MAPLTLKYLTLAAALFGALTPAAPGTTLKRRALNKKPTLPVRSYVALGDSFTAAPNNSPALPDPGPDKKCYRTVASWAKKLADDGDVVVQDTDNGHSEFHMMACSGYTSTNMTDRQITGRPVPDGDGAFKTDADLYTITVGGNDLEFGQIVKTCVYNMVATSSSVLYAAYGEACDKMLDKATEEITTPGSDFDTNVSGFFQALNEMITNADATVVVVPYVSFYNTDTARWFDTPSVKSSSSGTAVDNCRTPKDRRKRFTDLTNELNKFLRVKADNAGFSFVGNGYLQPKFDQHRFCETKDTTLEVFINDSLWNEWAAKECQTPANQDISQSCKDQEKGYDYKTGETLFHPNWNGHNGYWHAVKQHLRDFPFPNVD